MITVKTEIIVHAPIERLFDLARDIGLHTRTVWPHSDERAIAGRTEGLIELGEPVTFEARHFLIRQRLTSKVVAYERPFYFVDEMTSGPFKRLRHRHSFAVSGSTGGSTLMTDELTLAAPFGVLGRLAEQLVLGWYMKRFLEYRGRRLKRFAEEDGS